MKVLVQPWLRYDDSWRQQPDGISIHFTESQRRCCIDRYNVWYKTSYTDGTPSEQYKPAEGCAYWAKIINNDACPEVTLLALKGETFWWHTHKPSWLERL